MTRLLKTSNFWNLRLNFTDAVLDTHSVCVLKLRGVERIRRFLYPTLSFIAVLHTTTMTATVPTWSYLTSATEASSVHVNSDLLHGNNATTVTTENGNNTSSLLLQWILCPTLPWLLVNLRVLPSCPLLSASDASCSTVVAKKSGSDIIEEAFRGERKL